MLQKQLPWLRQNIWLLAVLALTVCVYIPSLSGDFVVDDVLFIRDNPYIQHWSDIGRYFTKGLWENSVLAVTSESQYRPMNLMPMLLNHMLWANNPFGYHLFALLLHLLNTVLVYVLVRKLGACSPLAATIGAAAFALHPARVESVAWISGEIDPLVTLFLLSAFLAHLHYVAVGEVQRWRFLALSLIAFQLALWSKEVAIGFPVIVLAYDWLYRRRIAWVALLWQAVLVLIYLLMRSAVLGSTGKWQDVGWPGLSRLFDFGLGYAEMLVLPLHVPLYIQPPQHAVSSGLGIICVMLLVGWAALGWKKFNVQKSRAAWFAWVWMLLFFWPALLLAFYTHGFYAGRFLYVPALGWALLIALLFDHFVRCRLIMLSAALLIAAYVSMTWRDIPAWHDAGTIYAKVVRDAPENAVGYIGLGDFYYSRGAYETAQENYLLAIEKNNTNDMKVSALVGLGMISGMSNRVEQSESYFTQAIRLDANNSDAWSGLGNLAQMRGDQANAMTAYEKAIKSKPGNYEATINLAAIYDSVGQVERARMLRQRAALLPH